MKHKMLVGVATFTNSIGEICDYDTWYPLPVIMQTNRGVISVLPVSCMSEDADMLMVKHSDGHMYHWGPWNGAREAAVEWGVFRSGWFQI